MPALHIMTFNLQMLPWTVETLIQGQTNDAKEVANRVADDLFALPAPERPDVIAFNEVFDEDGRAELLRRLRTTWPHIIKKMHDGGLGEDSGLMLFSRFPFRPLPTGGVLYERFYGDSDDVDAKVSKGVGVVRIDAPVGLTTIAFTHLQSSYQAEDEYSDIRVKQLDAIYQVLDQIFGGGLGPWGKVIVLGDLNVRGDSGAATGEWSAIFEPQSAAQPSTKLGLRMLDGWRHYMRPPGMKDTVDPGFTSLDFSNGKLQRLDYQCFAKKETFYDQLLVPHHMFVRLRNSSDHFSLEAIVQQPSSHCTPSDAIDFLSLPVIGGGPGTPSSIRVATINFVHEGSYQWLFVRKQGTYTIHRDPDTEVRLYAQSDLSHPLERIDTLLTKQLPPNVQAALVGHIVVDPLGETFVCRTPFFVAARNVKRDLGVGTVTLFEHRGESSATAIGLPAHQKVKSSFTEGQRLGNDDICWFKAWMPLTFTGAPRPERFVVDNPTGESIEISLRDIAEQMISNTSGAQDRLELTHQTRGNEFIYLTIKRSNDQVAGFSATWVSPVSYLLLEEPIGLYVDDESGIDRPGDDEPQLQINVDMDPFYLFDGSWDDADSGERWPNLDAVIRQRAQMRLPGAKKMGFVQAISVAYVEPDMSATTWLSVEVAALSPSESQNANRRISMKVPDDVKDGHYTFYCTITKIP